MQKIAFYLEKFSKIPCTEKQVREALQEIIFEKFKAEIPTDKISYNSGSVFIKETGPLKSEIFMHQKEIKTALEERLSRKLKIR